MVGDMKKPVAAKVSTKASPSKVRARKRLAAKARKKPETLAQLSRRVDLLEMTVAGLAGMTIARSIGDMFSELGPKLPAASMDPGPIEPTDNIDDDPSGGPI